MASRDAFAQAGANLAVVIRATEEAGEAALSRIGLEGDAEIKRILSEPGRGRVYVRKKRSHQASAPGQPPAVDFNIYRASWSWVVRKAGSALELLIGTEDKRAPWFEYGTSKMRPRPHARLLAEKLRGSAGVARTIGDYIVEYERRAIGRLPRG